MSDLPTIHSSRGSEWHRWDPHLHAPGTLLSDHFAGDWESYLGLIEASSPTIEALGVTDYLCIRTYREVRKRKAQGRLPNILLLFPNVEMRLDLKTEKKKPINIHLLFSPDDSNHEAEIERILSQLSFEFGGRTYQCTPSEFIKLGQSFDSKQTDEDAAMCVGANQFKVTLQDVRKLFRNESWMRKNCLVAVAGSSADGTSGLQKDDSFAGIRREIEGFAHIIFASTPSQRDFWLGKASGHDRSYIENTYGFLKPCLHGSDAHREANVGAPDLSRYCWIKGDLSFETLRQAVIEPERRVWIGNAPPSHTSPSISIREVTTIETPWLKNHHLQLNEGLVAIIGARGSGKTAFVDIVAAGCGSLTNTLGESSFLKRASSPVDLLGNSLATISWSDGSTTDNFIHPAKQAKDTIESIGDCCYLSQHFVEQLCSSSGIASELRHEMERVVFEATDPTERLETNSFDELAETLVEPIRRRRQELEDYIKWVSEAIVQEDTLRDRLGNLKKEHDSLKKQIENSRTQLKTLIPKGKEERAKRLAELESALTTAQAQVESIKRKRKTIDDLATEVTHIRTTIEPARLNDMRRRFQAADLSETQWTWFQMSFQSNVDAILQEAGDSADKAIKNAIVGDPRQPVDVLKTPLSEWPLTQIKTARDSVKKDVGIDTLQQKKFDDLYGTVAKLEVSLGRIEADIKKAEGADGRRRQLIDSRRSAYAQVFDTYTEEERVLNKLYEPLCTQISQGLGALSKLAFIVQRRVDLDAWVTKGEENLDLRSATRFRGHGALRALAELHLLPAWKSGSSEEVAKAMDSFLTEYHKDLLQAMPSSITSSGRSVWNQSVASWLFKTDHINVEYGIEYEGVAIEQTSPGTRGIVLLLLYIAIDQQDRRPLIIDQPEENLDPNSVFEELVPHFREARKRRQVIVVTHNANLVVNTDADQVIVATSSHNTDSVLPDISYQSGSLENPKIRRLVCNILEGGERAFLERERRYRLRWDQDSVFPSKYFS